MIFTHADDKYRLSIKEALLILHKNPTINRQFDNFSHTLRLRPNRTINNHQGGQNQITSNNPALGTTPPNPAISHNPTRPIDSPQSHIASSNVPVNSPVMDRSDQTLGLQSSSPQHTVDSRNINNNPLPSMSTNNHYISPRINERIVSLIDSTRRNLNTNHPENNTRSPINLRPRRQRISYFD